MILNQLWVWKSSQTDSTPLVFWTHSMWNRREAAIKFEILEFSGKHPMIFLPNIKTPHCNIKHPGVLNISTQMKTGGFIWKLRSCDPCFPEEKFEFFWCSIKQGRPSGTPYFRERILCITSPIWASRPEVCLRTARWGGGKLAPRTGANQSDSIPTPFLWRELDGCQPSFILSNG